MGKGDRRSRRGKIWRGTYGKYRPRKKKKKNSVKNNLVSNNVIASESNNVAS